MSNRAKIFWTGRSQAVRLPMEFRFDADEVAVRREGTAVILEPLNAWPDGWVESFLSPRVQFERSPQGRQERRKVVR